MKYLPSLKQAGIFAVLFIVGMNVYNRSAAAGKVLGNPNKG